MRQIAAALVMYRDTYGEYPPQVLIKKTSPFLFEWDDILMAEGVDERLFHCPCGGDYDGYEYHIGSLLDTTMRDSHGRRIFEALHEWCVQEDILVMCPHHYEELGGRRLVARSDGSVKTIKKPNFVKMTE